MLHLKTITLHVLALAIFTSTIVPANADFGQPPRTQAQRKLKYFAVQCRSNGGTIVQSGYGSGVVACHMSNGHIRFCQAVSNSQIQCWSDQTLPPPRPSSPENNNLPADAGSGAGQTQQPAPSGPIKGSGSGCSGDVC